MQLLPSASRLMLVLFLLPLVLFLLPLVQAQPAQPSTSRDTTLKIQVHYPASQIQLLSNNAIFALSLCYQPGCTTSDHLWNLTIPGSPYYNPRLTIFQDDYKGNDMYTKEIDLTHYMHSSSSTTTTNNNTVFVTIYAAYETPGNPYSRCAVKDECEVTNPVSNQCVHIGMPYRSVWQQQQQQLLVVAFPYFGMRQGLVFTLLPHLYSPQLDNFRNINVYVPSSLKQNPISRAVNVLTINDGSVHYLQQLAYAGGLDHAMLTGAVPETIMIGVPQNGSETDCQRQYELTFSSALTPSRCASGGTDFYLSFIRNTVVPAVLTALNIMPDSEVSMAGVSYGGLTACYAAAAMPEYFRRVFCQSPSLWWNYGELEKRLTAQKIVGAVLLSPLAVVMSIGSTEMGAPLCSDSACTSTTSWFTYVNDTVEAFRTSYSTHHPPMGLHFFTLAGGQHDQTNWATTFARGITQMFAYNSTTTTTFQMQYKEAVNVVYPPASNAECPTQHSSSSTNAGWVVLLVVLLILETTAIAISWCVLRRRCNSKQGDVNVKDYTALG